MHPPMGTKFHHDHYAVSERQDYTIHFRRTDATGTLAELRSFPPAPAEGDLGTMWVLDVLGVNIIVRDRADGLYVHLDTTVADTDRLNPDLPLLVEVNNNGEDEYT